MDSATEFAMLNNPFLQIFNYFDDISFFNIS